MAPQQEKFQNDATFQWLLSTQGEMSNSLISERRLQEDQYNQCNDPAVHGDWSNAATNQSIGFETFRTDKVAISKRMSVGVGADRFNMPDPNFDSDQFAESFYDEGKKRPKDWNEDSMNKKQTRRTTLSILDYIFEQNGEPKTNTVSKQSEKVKNRVEYMDSDDDDDYGMIVEDVSDDSESEAESFFDYIFDKNREPKTSTVMEQSKKVKNRVEYMDSDDDDYGVIVEDVSDDSESEADDEDDDEPKMAPEEAKKHLVLFEGLMEQSQDSQQKIHDWDRKMGLKRSHSKTMRLSSRSRKQLRKFTQKDIKYIIHLSNSNL
jgi:hypothetical protein